LTLLLAGISQFEHDFADYEDKIDSRPWLSKESPTGTGHASSYSADETDDKLPASSPGHSDLRPRPNGSAEVIAM